MVITLTGFMGSGKTTVGKVLADFLGCPFSDLDDLIEKKAGKSIPEIFAQDGEVAFRQLEAKLLRQTVEKYGENTAILSLGGGAVTTPASVTLLHEKTVCIYLRATLETLLHLMFNNSNRLTLTLIFLRVFLVDDIHSALALHDDAVGRSLLNGCLYFHFVYCFSDLSNSCI